jgi:hypothetical protein
MPNRFLSIMVLYPEAAVANRASLKLTKYSNACQRGVPGRWEEGGRQKAEGGRLDSVAAVMSGPLVFFSGVEYAET